MEQRKRMTTVFYTNTCKNTSGSQYDWKTSCATRLLKRIQAQQAASEILRSPEGTCLDRLRSEEGGSSLAALTRSLLPRAIIVRALPLLVGGHRVQQVALCEKNVPGFALFFFDAIWLRVKPTSSLNLSLIFLNDSFFCYKGGLQCQPSPPRCPLQPTSTPRPACPPPSSFPGGLLQHGNSHLDQPCRADQSRLAAFERHLRKQDDDHCMCQQCEEILR